MDAVLLLLFLLSLDICACIFLSSDLLLLYVEEKKICNISVQETILSCLLLQFRAPLFRSLEWNRQSIDRTQCTRDGRSSLERKTESIGVN